MQSATPQLQLTVLGTILSILLSIHITGYATAQEMTGREIMEEISRQHEVESELEKLEMILIDKKGVESNRTLRQFSRQYASGLYKYLLVFDDPKAIKGVALLTWEKEGGDDDQWIFLPAMGNKLKRIASGGRMNYFMGTDFAFEDLVAEQLDNFRYERLADQVLDEKDVFVLEAYPDNPDLVTGYEKRQIFVRKDNYIVVRVDYFQRRTGKLLKRLTTDKIKPTDSEKLRATERLMDNFDKKHKTKITSIDSSSAAEDVPERVFAHRFITSKSHMR